MHKSNDPERVRLEESRRRKVHWKRWGPYLSERQWGTIREDYSADGDAWEYFPHSHARFRAYRWGEDGIAGFCDRRQLICFSLALWNERDPFLKERLFGLGGKEGNHAEDVKECYYYLDSTPTHSYMKYLYRYPQAEFPYRLLREENLRRDKRAPEFELIDTGIFDDDRYFDVFVEYAKSTVEDVLIRIMAWNRGPDEASLHLLPHFWFRNTWSWNEGSSKPSLEDGGNGGSRALIKASCERYGERWLVFEQDPPLYFTENETNFERLYGGRNHSPYTKEAFHRRVVEGVEEAVRPDRQGTRSCAHFHRELGAGESWTIRLRLTAEGPASADFEESFDEVFEARREEADDFYQTLVPSGLSDEARRIQRQAFAGLLWSKQYYHYDVGRWLEGDPTMPQPPPRSRNSDWKHLYNADVISMPDKWEFPWYAAWDLAFQCLPLALVDPDFSKDQLTLFLREWYMHPNGQLPAYEWNFGDVNPPVHAWAVWRTYKIDARLRGKADREFLERAFHKLLINFTWWVNRKDPDGRNVFQGGFLGLDNIGVFDRSAPLPTGGRIEQSDATSWMGMYCLNMLAMALELARANKSYSDVASKFFEHFVYIAHAMGDLGEEGLPLWNEEEGFYYDVVTLPDGRHLPLRVRSMVGLIPLFAVETLEPDIVDELPGFRNRMQWFIENHPDVPEQIEMTEKSDKGVRRLLSIVNRRRLERVLRVMLDEEEFLSPFGIRSLSRCHLANPYRLNLNGETHEVGYEPAESTSYLFGGNSNWRGPVWFPTNFLIIESLQRFHHYFGDGFKVEYPTGSGRHLNLWDVAEDLSKRLIRIFLPDEKGHRPVFGGVRKFQEDPHWREHLLFYEYFHGDNGAGIGASHQTGWTALVAKLIRQCGE